MYPNVADVVRAVKTTPGRPRSAVARSLRGARLATRLAIIDEAVACGLVRLAETRVPAKSGAYRTVQGLFPAAASSRSAAPTRLDGARLRELRQRRGCTVPQLAGRAGISSSLVYAIEAGRQRITSATESRLRGALERRSLIVTRSSSFVWSPIVGAALREARLAAAWSLDECGRNLGGRTRQTIARWERDGWPPRAAREVEAAIRRAHGVASERREAIRSAVVGRPRGTYSLHRAGLGSRDYVWAVLERLEAEGLVERIGVGQWQAVGP